MSRKTIFSELESLAEELIERYPTGFVWPCATAIQVLEGDCPDTSQAIIRGSYQKVRASGTACQMAKNTRIPFLSPVSTAAVAEAI